MVQLQKCSRHSLISTRLPTGKLICSVIQANMYLTFLPPHLLWLVNLLLSANGFISLNGTARSIEVFDMQGRLVSHSVNTARVEINGISRGMYIVRVTDMNGNVISKKILLGK